MKIESLSERLRRGDSILNLFVWTLVGVALQLAIAIPALSFSIYGFTDYLISKNWGGYSPFTPFPPNLDSSVINLLMTLYALLPLVIFLAVSAMTRPKRIVSMTRIQIITVTVFGLLVLAGVSPHLLSFQPTQDTVNFITSFALAWILTFMFFGIFGFFQTWFIRWWIGVNEGALTPRTYSIALDFADFRNFLLNEFTHSYELRTRRNERDLLVLNTYGRCRVIMACGPDRSNPSRSILCLVPLEHGNYEISTTDEAVEVLDDVSFILKGRLSRRAEVNDAANDPVLERIAHSIAVEPTRTRFATTKDKWARIGTEFKTAFAFTVAAWILTTALFFDQKVLNITLDFGIYWEITVLLIIAAVAELGIPLAQQLRETRSATRTDTSP